MLHTEPTRTITVYILLLMGDGENSVVLFPSAEERRQYLADHIRKNHDEAHPDVQGLDLNAMTDDEVIYLDGCNGRGGIMRFGEYFDDTKEDTITIPA